MAGAGWAPAASHSSRWPRCRCSPGDSSACGPRSKRPGGDTGWGRGGHGCLGDTGLRVPGTEVQQGPRSPGVPSRDPGTVPNPVPKVPTEPPWRVSVTKVEVSHVSAPPALLVPKGPSPQSHSVPTLLHSIPKSSFPGTTPHPTPEVPEPPGPRTPGTPPHLLERAAPPGAQAQLAAGAPVRTARLLITFDILRCHLCPLSPPGQRRGLAQPGPAGAHPLQAAAPLGVAGVALGAAVHVVGAADGLGGQRAGAEHRGPSPGTASSTGEGTNVCPPAHSCRPHSLPQQ